MKKTVDRIIKILVALAFTGVVVFIAGPKISDAIKGNLATTVTTKAGEGNPIALLADKLKGNAARLANDATTDPMRMTGTSAPGTPSIAVERGYAPNAAGISDIAASLGEEKFQLLVTAVAAELSRRNYVATEIKRDPASVAQAFLLWAKEQQGDMVPEIKTGEIDSMLLAKAHEAEKGVILGNHDAAFTLVEFFDPNCPHCRLAIPHLLAWIDREPGVRVLFREFPVIAPQSADVAKVALAMGAQGLYRPWLETVAGWKGGVIDGKAARDIAEGLGADMKRLDAAANSTETAKAIADTLELGANLQIDGTPAMVIGRKLAIGSATTDWLADFSAQQGGPIPAKPVAAPSITPAP